MISILLCVCLPANGFSYAETESRLNPLFEKFPREVSALNRRLLADGAATKIVFPPNLEPQTIGRDNGGRLVGNLAGQFGGAYSSSMGFAVLFVRGKYAVAQPLKQFPYSRVTAVDANHRIIGIAYSSPPPSIDASQDVSHGFLMSKGKTFDLGSAEEVKFGRDGSISGSYRGNTKGTPVNMQVQGETFTYRFTWFNGKRRAIRDR